MENLQGFDFGNDPGGTRKMWTGHQFVSSRDALHLSGRTTETLHAVGHADLGDATRGGTGLGAIDLVFEGSDHLVI